MTLARNRAAFQEVRLVPRVLEGERSADTRAAVLDAPVSTPIMVAPMAVQGLAHPEGELATARVAGGAGTIMALSTVATMSLDSVAGAAMGTLWFQLYVYRGPRRVPGDRARG